MTRILTAAVLAAALSLGACAGPFSPPPLPTDPVERTLAGAGMGAAAGAGIGALISLPFPVAIVGTVPLGAIAGAAVGGMTGLFTTPQPAP